MAQRAVPHLMTLADLSPAQIHKILSHAYYLKNISQPWLSPQQRKPQKQLRMPSQSLFNKTIALMFSKRSTRTRVSAETATVLLGGRALFLGREDIQLGVNESARDTARVVGGMCQGIFARVGDHSEIEVCLGAMMQFTLLILVTGIGSTFSCAGSQCVVFAVASHADSCGSANAA